MSSFKLSPFHTAFVISITFLFGYIVLASMGLMLSIEPGYAFGEVSRWGERIVDGIFREPSNALSNLGFMISGLVMFKVLSDEKPRENQRFYGVNKTSGIFAAAVIYLGPGSMLMHGTHTEWGQWADNLSMVMFIVFPWIYNLKCMGGWSENRFVSVYILVVTTYAITRWAFGDGLGIGLDLFGLSIGLEQEYEPIIMAGVAAQMMSGTDIPPATTQYITEQMAISGYPVGSSNSIRNSLLQYQQLLIQQARKDLRARFPEPVSINSVVYPSA